MSEAPPRRETMIALRARREALHVASAIALPELHVEKIEPPLPDPDPAVLAYLSTHEEWRTASSGLSSSDVVDWMCRFVVVAGLLSGAIAVAWRFLHR